MSLKFHHTFPTKSITRFKKACLALNATYSPYQRGRTCRQGLRGQKMSINNLSNQGTRIDAENEREKIFEMTILVGTTSCTRALWFFSGTKIQ